ncbi:MAG: flagellar export chaperone FlgN [Phycisphaeraceae bacterium]|nr:flagellar export chaperone FlgN [Phycisphaeraceae bacterium]
MMRSNSPDPARAADELEAAVRDLVAEHERLIAAVAEQRAAVAAADGAAMNRAIARQGESAQRIAEIERRRIAAVGVLAAPACAGSRPDPSRVRVSELAATLPEPSRSRITDAASALKAALERLHREYGVLREAAAQLAAHLEGITRQVYARVSHTGAYARSGVVGPPVQVVSSLDLRT